MSFLLTGQKSLKMGKWRKMSLSLLTSRSIKIQFHLKTLSPFKTSGIRIGSPAITSRGMGEKNRKIAELIVKALENYQKRNYFRGGSSRG